MDFSDKITIVITSSPSPRHPDTAMIRETIDLMRTQVTCPIIILQDGIREEQKHLEKDYSAYKRRLRNWAMKSGLDIAMIEYAEHKHQTGMIKSVLRKDLIATPQMLFIEHDFPVIGNIPWQEISAILEKGSVDLVRFYLETDLEPAHKHLFLDEKPVSIGGVPLIRTGQWSQRPHLANVSYYKRVFNRYVSKDDNNYIEDTIHGYFGEPFATNPKMAWKKNRLCIYHPEGLLTRCKHLDGRLDEPKY